MSGVTMFGVHIPELQLPPGALRAAIELSGLSEGETYVELGSGEGRGLVMAARDFGARASGVEYVEHAIEATHRRAAAAGVEVDVARGDLMTYDAAHADVLLLHLGPAFHDVLAPLLEHQLGPHTRVVACGWRVPGWLPAEERWHDGVPLRLYRPGAPAYHGAWSRGTTFRHLEPGSVAIDEVVFDAGVDLEAIELRVSGAGAKLVTARAAAERLGRGQQLSVFLELTGPSPAELLAGDDQAAAGDEAPEAVASGDAAEAGEAAAAPAPSSTPFDAARQVHARVALHARSRSGRITRRGEEHVITLMPA